MSTPSAHEREEILTAHYHKAEQQLAELDSKIAAVHAAHGEHLRAGRIDDATAAHTARGNLAARRAATASLIASLEAALRDVNLERQRADAAVALEAQQRAESHAAEVLADAHAETRAQVDAATAAVRGLIEANATHDQATRARHQRQYELDVFDHGPDEAQNRRPLHYPMVRRSDILSEDPRYRALLGEPSGVLA